MSSGLSNSLVAALTALTYAELATSFPENGGTYLFAKRAISLRAAFGLGWILWFAYLVAGVLYALGFGAYATSVITTLWPSSDLSSSAQLWLGKSIGVVAIIVYVAILTRTLVGGGQWESIGKVIVFVIVIVSSFSFCYFS